MKKKNKNKAKQNKTTKKTNKQKHFKQQGKPLPQSCRKKFKNKTMN